MIDNTYEFRPQAYLNKWAAEDAKTAGCEHNDDKWCKFFNEWCSDVTTMKLSENEIRGTNYVKPDYIKECMKFNASGGYMGYYYHLGCRICLKDFSTPKVLKRRGGISDDMNDDVDIFTCERCQSGDIDNSVNEWISRTVEKICQGGD